MRTANITIHVSQFPDTVHRDLLASLRTRQVNHKFHYDSVRQTQKWLALHQAYSPSRNDADGRAVYEQGFAAVAAQIKSLRVHVIGLGCGGGQKDTCLLTLLKSRGKEVFYTPCDVSTAMVLTARQTALAILREEDIRPFVCDLATANDLCKALVTRHTSLVTFFGMIPNFEPQIILPKLASLVRPKDFLLFSANLAPGKNYAAGVKQILPQYDNPPTRDWLMTFLLGVGVECNDGRLGFKIEDAKAVRLKRIVADFRFARPRRIKIGGAGFEFRRGECVRLFFSYRYTPERVRAVLDEYGLEVRGQWIAQSGEEGVFFCCNSEGRALRAPD